MKRNILSLVFLVVLASDGLACSCVTIGDNPVPMPTRDAIFRGRVVASQLVVVGEDGNMFVAEQDRAPARLYRVAVLEVLEKFKGDIPPFVIVATGSGDGDCGYPFEVGKTYVLDGEWSSDKVLARLGGAARVITTSICSMTAEDGKVEAMLQRLRYTHKSASPLFVK